MDLLTHLFLPITVAYVLRPELFPSPWYLGFAIFAVLPDADKLLGVQGMLHSLLVLGVIGVVLLGAERLVREDHTYALLAVGLLFSHLLLDLLDGGPVPFLYPIVDAGVGLHYPAQLVLQDTVAIRNPLPEVRVGTPNRSRQTYPIVTGYGVLSGLTFLTVYLGERLRRRSL